MDDESKLDEQHDKCDICLVVMCGLPGAGKTTLTENLVGCSDLLRVKCTSAPLRQNTICVLPLHFDDIIPSELPVDDGGMPELVAGEVDDSHGKKDEQSTMWKQYRQAIHSAIEKLLYGVRTRSIRLNSRTKEPDPQDVLKSNFETKTENEIDRTVVEQIQAAIRKWNFVLEESDQETHKNEEEEAQGDDQCLVLILDDNMFYRSMRFEYYQLARKYGTGFAQLYLQCPTSIAVDRNQTRKHPVAMETIIKMASNLEIPDPVKAPWEEYTVVVDAEKQWNDDDLKRIWCVVKQALAKPAPPYQEIDTREKIAAEVSRRLVLFITKGSNYMYYIKGSNYYTRHKKKLFSFIRDPALYTLLLLGKEESRQVSLASAIHQADVVLRKCVAEIMKKTKSNNQPSKQELRLLARSLNNLRSDILNQIRHKQLELPPLTKSDGQEGNENRTFHAFIKELFQTRTADILKDAVR